MHGLEIAQYICIAQYVAICYCLQLPSIVQLGSYLTLWLHWLADRCISKPTGMVNSKQIYHSTLEFCQADIVCQLHCSRIY